MSDFGKKCKFLKHPYIVDIDQDTRYYQMLRIISNRPNLSNIRYEKYKSFCKRLSDYVEDPNSISKCKIESTQARYQGDVYLIEYSLKKAFLEYTRSIALAPKKTVELALAYDSRSYVLFISSWFSDCIIDINNALDTGHHPYTHRSRLLLRKAECMWALKSKYNYSQCKFALDVVYRFINLYDDNDCLSDANIFKEKMNFTREDVLCKDLCYDALLEQIPAENKKILGFSEAINCVYSVVTERKIIATRDINAGEIIALQKPFVNIINSAMRYEYCWHCGKQTWSSIPCDKCSDVIFCSLKCRNEANYEYHNIECSILRQILPFGIKDGVSITLKLIIKALIEAGSSFDNLIQNLDAICGDQTIERFINGTLYPEKYTSIYKLMPIYIKNEESTCETVIESIIITYFIYKKLKIRPQWQNNFEYKLITLIDIPKFLFFCEFVEKNIQMRILKNLEITSPGPETRKFLSIGNISFINHSCKQMLIRMIHGDKLVVKTLYPIKEGQQIFDNYHVNFAENSKNERMEYLCQFNEICQCDACIDDWETYEYTMMGVDNLPTELSVLHDNVMLKKNQLIEYCFKHHNLMNMSTEIQSACRLIHEYFENENLNSPKMLMAIEILKTALFITQQPIFNLD